MLFDGMYIKVHSMQSSILESVITKGHDEKVEVRITGVRPSDVAPAVLFIGGLGASADSHIGQWNFDETADPDLRATFPSWGIQPMVARYTTTLSFDWPGVGRSCSNTSSFPTMRDEAVFVRTLATGHGISPPYVVVGHSMGAKTALMMLQRYPNDVLAAVIIDPAPWSTLTDRDAMPTGDHEAHHPSAAARIRAAIASWNAGHFDVPKLRATD